MRISLDHRFVFLNNVKCASTSINKVITRFSQLTPNEPDIRRHMTARQMLDVLAGREIPREEMFVFTTIRNPWDRMVSQWFHSKRAEVSIFHEIANRSESLEEFVSSPRVRRAYRDRHSYSSFCCGPDGVPLVDMVIRSEDVDATIPHLMRTLGIDADLSAPRANPSHHTPYRDYYNDRARGLVAALLWDDIEVGRYVF